MNTVSRNTVKIRDKFGSSLVFFRFFCTGERFVSNIMCFPCFLVSLSCLVDREKCNRISCDECYVFYVLWGVIQLYRTWLENFTSNSN